MGRRHTVNISNGQGKIKIVNGTYKVSATAAGYDSDSLTPQNVSIIEGTNEYTFNITASGTLTLHVTETGESSGTQVIGAKFIRTDSNGTIIGKDATTDSNGDAIFQNVPFSSNQTAEIYIKQITSDGAHTFEETVKTIKMTTDAETVQITNPQATERTISLVDTNYINIPVKDGQIILEEP